MEEDDEDGARDRFEGVANPEEEYEDDRFFGDGLTSDQKDILDYVDDIDPEEVRIFLAIRICYFRGHFGGAMTGVMPGTGVLTGIFNAFHDLGALRLVGGSKDDPQV